jgi:inorganic pyrophosphatase
MGKQAAINLGTLTAFEESEELNVVIETPKGSRNKFKYDEKRGLFKLSGVLPVGAVYPFDFGFIPSTLGGDGDPLDVLILMDEPAFPGCLIPARLIGVIEADQTEEGETSRNDRLIAVAVDSRIHNDIQELDDLNEALVNEIEHFFISFNQAKGKQFEPIGRFGPERAMDVVNEGIRITNKKQKSHSRAKGRKKKSRSKE